MTEIDILADVIQREGGWRDAVQRPDKSWDPATNWGITLETLRRWRQRDFPGAVVTEVDLRQLTQLQASGIYQAMYVTEPGFTAANIPFEPLRVQLIDFGVNSGPERAVRWLQRILGLPVTGVMDSITRDAMQEERENYQDEKRPLMAIVNDALVAARSYMIDQAVDHGTVRKIDEEGVESRALSFFLATPSTLT